MLNKLLNVKKLTPFLRQVPAKTSPEKQDREGPSALKLVHAGGNAEFYYMAMPAAKIMEKYPSFLLARPEVFRRPWDSIVHPEEILTPGEKFFLVPKRTVRKLRRRMKKSNNGDHQVSCTNSFVVSQAGVDSTDGSAEMGSSQSNEDEIARRMFQAQRSQIHTGHNSGKVIGISKIESRKSSNRHINKHVRFIGVDSDKEEKKRNKIKDVNVNSGKSSSSSNSQSSRSGNESGRKKRVQNSVSWQPSLAAISESSDSDV